MTLKIRIWQWVGDEAIESELHLMPSTDDGLIACPICNLRMKEEAVFSHLDVHNAPEAESRARTIPTR